MIQHKYFADCRYFKGHIPCKPHKQDGIYCEICSNYSPSKEKILIIKLGAIGDVIRTTPLLHRIKVEYPNALVYWLTDYPDVLPSSIDYILHFNLNSILQVQVTKFDVLINLDKDYQACALASQIDASNRFGFTMKDGKPCSVNELAESKFLTGLFDDVNKSNRKSYLEEIFEICGWVFNGEEYILEFDSSVDFDINSQGKPIIGLNTGCGDRWVSRLWSNDNWVRLIGLLQDNGFEPLLLGGKQEHEKNLELSSISGAKYLGHFPLKDFIALMNKCDGIVSAVTMAMHIAVGLKKRLFLMNNIFNPFEFELYGRGEIISPDKECKCYFSSKCKNPEYFCMEHLPPEKIFNVIKKYF